MTVRVVARAAASRALWTAVGLSLLCAVSLSAQSGRSGNPIIAGWYADPEAHVFDGQSWIFPTYSAPYGEQTFMDAFSSRDLVTWISHSRVLDTANVGWARRALWAPSIVAKGGWYYPNPSSTVFRTVRSPSTRRCFRIATVEGAYMLVKNGTYYFMWSEGGWTGPNYAVAYAMGSSPFGPFERVGKILQRDSTVATGAGHHSVLHSPGSPNWYVVYHRRPLGETDRNHRVVSIDKLEFDERGLIRPVVITTAGVPANRLPGSKRTSRRREPLGTKQPTSR